MADLCTKCGKPLQQGQVCSCQAQGSEKEENQGQVENLAPKVDQRQEYKQQFDAVKEKSVAIFQRVIGLIIAVFKDPVKSLEQFAASGDYTLALVLIGIQAVLSGLFGLCVLGKVNGPLHIFSLPKVFFVTLFASYGLSCLLALLLFGLVKALGGKTKYPNMLCVAGARSIALLPVTLVSLVLFFINNGFGTALFYAGNLLGMIFIFTAVKKAAEIEEKKMVYILFFAMLLFLIANGLAARYGFPLYYSKGMKSMGLNNPFSMLDVF